MAIEPVWPDERLEAEMMNDALNSFRFPACARDVQKHVKSLLTRVRVLEEQNRAVVLRCQHILGMCCGEHEMKAESKAMLELLGIPLNEGAK